MSSINNNQPVLLMRVRGLRLEKELVKCELHHYLGQHSIQSGIKTAPDLGIWSLTI